jgi:predicted Kef-type K+ transport protein
MNARPVYWYALFCGVFLLVQGTSTLAARLVPAIDRAIPALLATTQMVPTHSLLHIVTALAAFATIAAGARAMFGFALAFGAFYVGLALAGIASGHRLGLGLQPFDHPFHLLLGGLGLLAAWRARRSAR